MSWKEHLEKAKAHLKSSRLEDSLREVNEALRVGGDREYTVYDSRAAIHERQGKPKNALQDVKNVIQLAPAHWQGYARAARLFLRVRKLDEATTMADMALSRLDPNDSMRRKKLNELKEEVLEHRRSQIYHFGKLPVEIITAIFEMVVVPEWSRVLTIWAVSKHWNSIALNTPNLWSTLILTNRHPARHAQRWIERSKGRIREISLRSTLSHSPVSLNGLLWSHLRVCKLENHDIAEYIGGKSKLHRLSALEELEVTHATLNCDPLLSIPDPKLRRLTLTGAPFSWDTLASNHRNLTSLEIRHPRAPPSLEEFMVILESNPMLEHLGLDLDTFGSSTSTTPPPLILQNLRSLHFANTPWTPLFFSLVAMPCLETLRLSRIRTVGLSALIERRPQLIFLGVNSCIMPSTELLELLDITPTLRSLELTRLSEGPNAVVDALAGRSAALCPALEQLDISHCPDVKTGPIVALINSRNPQVEVGGEVIQKPPAEGPVPARVRILKTDGCPQIQANLIPWIRTQVETFSCMYLTKRAASWRR